MNSAEPKKMVVARKGSPILIGISNDSIFVASEKIAFEKYTSQYFDVEEGEIIEIDLEKRFEFSSMERVKEIKEKTVVEVHCKPQYCSFFEQEMYE